jgi:hypothetical protein
MARKVTPALAPGYDVSPSIAYASAILNNLPATTGKSLDEWIRLVESDGPKGEKERRQWLQKAHQLGGTTAWMIAERAEGTGAEDTDPEAYLRVAAEWVEAMYAGPKAALRPLHDALVQLGRRLGADVKVCPCKTIVPLYRHHVFAQIKPATRSRIDFGLALRGTTKKLPARLIDTGGLQKKDRITHRFAITALPEIDTEVRDWLQVAYELDVG